MLLDEIAQRWKQKGVSTSSPVVRTSEHITSLDDIAEADTDAGVAIPPNSVVAFVGDFSPSNIAMLLRLIDLECVIAPLTNATAQQHEMFFDIAGVEWIIDEGTVKRRPEQRMSHPLISELKTKQSPGLILFSSGTTGTPKAALHDFSKLLDKFRKYNRPSLTTLAFLLFDHIGGLNTLLHTLYNAGTIHVPTSRRPSSIMRQVAEEHINLLPTTPSFLRLSLVENAFEQIDLSQLKLVTYGTERMDQATLDRLNEVLPAHVDIRQTYGMSELGIFPLKNRSKSELWIRVVDPMIDVETRDGVLHIRTPHGMLGYLNSPNPFDEQGWFNTRDIAEFENEYFRILGRTDDVINVGGIKIQPGEIEDAAHKLSEVCYVRACGEPDPFLGEHIRLNVQLVEGTEISKREFRAKLNQFLDRDKMPHKIAFEEVAITARYKRA